MADIGSISLDLRINLEMGIAGQLNEVASIDSKIEIPVAVTAGTLTLQTGVVQEKVGSIVEAISTSLGVKDEEPLTCGNHHPVQHRDAKPPWCNTCGRTAEGLKPQAHFIRSADGTLVSGRPG